MAFQKHGQVKNVVHEMGGAGSYLRTINTRIYKRFDLLRRKFW